MSLELQQFFRQRILTLAIDSLADRDLAVCCEYGDANFKEEEHPRDEEGKFSSGGGSSTREETSPKHREFQEAAYFDKGVDLEEHSIKSGIKGNPKQCTQEALKGFKNGEELHLGEAVDKAGYQKSFDWWKDHGVVSTINRFPHAWNVKDGEIIDRGLGSNEAKDYLYFGAKIPDNEVEKIKDGDDLARNHSKLLKAAVGGTEGKTELPSWIKDNIDQHGLSGPASTSGENSWSSELTKMGADLKAIKEMEELFDGHRYGKENQEEADKKLGEAVHQDTPLGNALRKQVSLEEGIFDYWESVGKKKAADKWEAKAKDELKWEWDNGMGNNAAYENMEEQWKTEHQYQYDRMREPTVFYRKGDANKDVIATTTNSTGAQSHKVIGSAPQPHFEPNKQFTPQELHDQGYHILGGLGFIRMGYPGESEVTWIKDKKEEKPATDDDLDEIKFLDPDLEDLARGKPAYIVRQINEIFQSQRDNRNNLEQATDSLLPPELKQFLLSRLSSLT